MAAPIESVCPAARNTGTGKRRVCAAASAWSRTAKGTGHFGSGGIREQKLKISRKKPSNNIFKRKERNPKKETPRNRTFLWAGECPHCDIRPPDCGKTALTGPNSDPPFEAARGNLVSCAGPFLRCYSRRNGRNLPCAPGREGGKARRGGGAFVAAIGGGVTGLALSSRKPSPVDSAIWMRKPQAHPDRRIFSRKRRPFVTNRRMTPTLDTDSVRLPFPDCANFLNGKERSLYA